MTVLSLYLPRLGTDRVRTRSRVDPRVPILLKREDHQRELVAACCALAERSGVRIGMTLSQAGALLRSAAHVEEWDAAALKRSLRRLAAYADRFTPRVALDPPEGLWLDVSGCEHLFRGVDAMSRTVSRGIEGLGFECRVGAAPTAGAAWAAARFGGASVVRVRAGRIAEMLSPWPVAALRLNAEQQEALREVGIETVAQVMAVPRAQLAERYGADVPRWLDRALGVERETIDPIRVRPPLAVGRAFAGPTDRPESIALCVRQLIEEICGRLEKREAGCREIVVVLMRSDLPALTLTALAGRPTRDAKHWYRLLSPRLERAHLGFGVEGVEVSVRGVRTLRHEQISRWIEPARPECSEGVSRLADVLAARLGTERVLRMRARASHIPERAGAFEQAMSGLEDAIDGTDVLPPEIDRPTLLLPTPKPIGAVYLVPHGPLASVRVQGEVRRVVRGSGPERIGGEWWRRERGTRDYYRIQIDGGAWVWVYRALESGRWFLHGEWA